jgi:cell division protein FtsA
MPVRLGVPQFVEGLSDVVRNPIHATGVGLLLYSRQAQKAKAEASSNRSGVTNAFERMRGWFQKNF